MAIFAEVTETEHVMERLLCIPVLFTMFDMAEGPNKSTNFVFDHFGPNIKAEDNRSGKSSLIYQPCFCLITNYLL